MPKKDKRSWTKGDLREYLISKEIKPALDPDNDPIDVAINAMDAMERAFKQVADMLRLMAGESGASPEAVVQDADPADFYRKGPSGG